MTVETRNKSTVQDVLAILKKCDFDFSPKLSERVDLSDYSVRIINNAERFECWRTDELIGLIAVYCNAEDKHTAFITNVSVEPNHRKKGLARQLLKSAILHLKNKEFKQITLEVNVNSNSALALYKSEGFVIIAQEGDIIKMNYSL